MLFHHVTCDITFCLLPLCPNKEKEKETQNKIKEYKRKGKQNKTKSIVHNSNNNAQLTIRMIVCRQLGICVEIPRILPKKAGYT